MSSISGFILWNCAYLDVRSPFDRNREIIYITFTKSSAIGQGMSHNRLKVVSHEVFILLAWLDSKFGFAVAFRHSSVCICLKYPMGKLVHDNGLELLPEEALVRAC